MKPFLSLIEGVPLIYQEDTFLVVEKPSGLLSQPGLGSALQDSLISRIKKRWPSANLVHRLDRDTSGLLLIALDPAMHRTLSKLFIERAVNKRYRAHVTGRLHGASGSIDAPIGKCGNQPPRYAVDLRGKPSRTDWRLIERHGSFSSLDLVPLTGRSHQLRVHLAHLGHPIIGDPIYSQIPPSQHQRLHLHATLLSFQHPTLKEEMTFHSSCPF
ncbi:MAG: RluA family pseudouridine synthase [Methylococcaceae bacterium]